MKLYMRWKWFDLSWLKIFRTSSDWFPCRAKCWCIKPSASILLLYENISLNSRARSWTECLYFELSSTFSCVQEDITGNSRARSKTECLYFCFCQVNLLWWLADFIEYPSGWLNSFFTFYFLPTFYRQVERGQFYIAIFWHGCKLQNLLNH